MKGRVVLAAVTVVALVFGLAVVADGALTANRQLRRDLRELRRQHELLVRWAQDELRPWLVEREKDRPPEEPPPEVPPEIPTPTVTPAPVPTPSEVPTPPPVPEPSPTGEPSPTCIPVVELCL